MKGEENVSGMVMVIGVLVITLLTIGIGMSMFGGVSLPSSSDSNLSDENLEAELADLSDQCWRKSGKGSEIKRIDCFQVSINTEREIERDDISLRLEEVPSGRFKLEKGLEFQDIEKLRVTYSPKTKTINLSKLR